MCGRYASAIPAMDLAAAFGIRPENVLDDLPPSYNVAPTDPVPAVLARQAEPGGETARELRTLRWGLLPWWATDVRVAARQINARVETVADRPAYRSALAARRCLLPANGYFEWQVRPGGGKQPFFLRPPAGEVLVFAGLYERWRAPAGDVRWTCTILTTSATGPLAGLHDRTPMVIPQARWDKWLDPARTDPSAALGLPVPATDFLDAYPVHPRVGNVRQSGPELIARYENSMQPLPEVPFGG